MAARLAVADQMTVEEFLAFADARPDGERWELIEGQAIMNASPTEWHQVIVMNLAAVLRAAKVEKRASWTPLLGVGTQVSVSPNSLPVPDLFVKDGALANASVTGDALVLFEVLSKSNTSADQAWRRRVYASAPNCQHYVTVATVKASITRYDRATGWVAMTVSGLDEILELPIIDTKVPLAEVYRWTQIK
jgi:Uma2 family endonuclease